MTNEPLRRIAWIDATHGVAGDMLLGALLDAGVELATLQAAVDAVIPGTVRLVADEVTRGGMRALHVRAELLAEDQHHRGWSTIDRLIADAAGGRGRDDEGAAGAAPLPPTASEWARSTFRRIAEVESRAHGISVEDVHFHEVGAWDSIADIVGVCAGLVALGVEQVVGSPVALGNGMVRMAHGELAVPGPAVSDLARGWPVLPGPDGAGELATPTGMALLRIGDPGPMPPMVVSAVGTGAGTKDLPRHANITRVVIGEPADAVGPPVGQSSSVDPLVPEHGARTMLACTVDDLDPRLWPGVLDRLVAAGADDAWLLPVVMRKGRPGHVLEVLARPELAESLREVIYQHTTTLGIRSWEIHRDALHRDWVEVDVLGETVRVKRGIRSGRVVGTQPEHADVVAAANALGLSELEVLRRAQAALHNV
ncbi:nickel pincer cofactor biosynthesis protein LarC [Granulicoccus sp. GXG6511]|uniref:nickel pincer cofactor biosynthesis protein LarC n=1 Tax=Granulicoccus sp. GXG6511 TaxID=3381351 RepID=UPI003D7D8C7E